LIELSNFYQTRYSNPSKSHVYSISSDSKDYSWFIISISNRIAEKSLATTQTLGRGHHLLYQQSESSSNYLQEFNKSNNHESNLVRPISNIFYLISLLFFYRINIETRSKLEHQFELFQSENISKQSLDKILESLLEIINSDNLLYRYKDLIKFNKTHFHTLEFYYEYPIKFRKTRFHTLEFYKAKYYKKKKKENYIDSLSIITNSFGSSYLKKLERNNNPLQTIKTESFNKSWFITKSNLRDFIQDFRFKDKKPENDEERKLRDNDLSKTHFPIPKKKPNDTIKYSLSTRYRYYGVMKIMNDLKHCIEDLRLANLIMKIFHENSFKKQKNESNIRLIANEIRSIIIKQNIDDLQDVSKSDIQRILKESFVLSFNQN
jgi:hypothetical protein